MAEAVAPLPDGFQLDAAPIATGLPDGFTVDAPTPPSTAEDVGKSLVTGGIKGGANFAAAATAPGIMAPAMGFKYGVPMLKSLGNDAEQGLENLGHLATGTPTVSDDAFNAKEQQFNEEHPILHALDPATLASKIPSAGDAVASLAKIAGKPLYEPQTDAGRAAEAVPEYAGLGGAKALETLPSVVGMVGAQTGVKELGGGQALQDIAGLAGGIGGGVAGEKVGVSNIKDTVNNAQPQSAPPDAAPETPSSQSLKARARPYYKASKNAGINFTDDAQSALPDQVLSDFDQSDVLLDDAAHPRTLSALKKLQSASDNGDISMAKLHQIRQLFGNGAQDTRKPDGSYTDDGRASLIAVNAIDNFLDDAHDNPDQYLTKGDPTAIENWRTGQQLWKAANQVGDLERLQNKAEFRQNPAVSMREYLATLAANPKRMSSFSPETQNLIREGTESGLSDEALRTIGSRLTQHVAGGIGAGLGGFHGYVLGELASLPIGMAARGLAANRMRGKIQNMIGSVTNGLPGEYQAPAAKAAPLQIGNQINMPPPETPAPAAAQTAPEAPRGPLALPSPKDMTYEDMARTGRILQSPDKTPINMTNGAPATTYNPLDLNRGDESQFAGAKNAGLDLSKLKASDAQKAVDLQSQRENDIAELSAIAKGAGINSIVKDKDFSKGATDDNDQGQTDARPQAVNQSNAVGERQQVAAGSSRSRQEGSQVGEGVSGSPSNNQALTKAQQIDAAAVHANTEPTEAQKDAGNYQKGHVNIQGLNVSIENPAGTSRSGTGPEGPWENEMPAHYGYIRKTMGADGDHLDTFIGDNPESKKVFVVDQKDPATGLFDEHKALIGFDDQKSALDAYKNSFSDGSGSRRVGAVNPMSMDNFKSWAKGDTTDKPTSYQEPKDMVNANLSAATSNIPGISRLLEQANGGDKAAHGLLNNIAYDSIDRLTSGIPSAKVIVDRNSGLYGGSVEPSLGVRMEFNASDRPAALAALAKFAQNFKQEQIHLRQPDDAEVGTRYDDGSYVTPVRSIELKSPMTQKQVQNIVDKSGLYGLTVNDKYLEAYYVGDPKDANAIDQFTKGFEKAAELAGSKNGGVGRTSQRLWVYGEGQDAIPYSKIAGDLPKPQKTSTDIPKQVAEATAGKTVTPAEQAKTITPEQKATQQQIARDYEKLPDNDLKNPLVQKAYSDLNREVVKQYNALPIKVDAWADKQGNKWTPRGGEPYKSSQEMRDDILNNYHLYVFTTSKGQFGPEGVDMTGHPLLENTGIKSDNGYPMLANDVLRAVHDYYGHLLSPTEFGPKGEEAAWKNHVATINSPMARWALTSETRGQNSWVNFGDHVDPKSSLKDRPFARQKAALLPIEHSMTGDPNLDAPMQKLARSLTAEQRKGSLGKKETGE